LSLVCGRSVQAVPVARSMMAAVPGQAFSSGDRPRSRSPSVCNATSHVGRVSEDACQDQAVCRPSEVGRDETAEMCSAAHRLFLGGSPGRPGRVRIAQIYEGANQI
jgi:hypothetical protein